MPPWEGRRATGNGDQGHPGFGEDSLHLDFGTAMTHAYFLTMHHAVHLGFVLHAVCISDFNKTSSK
jgi:hypothetical protein